MARRPRVTEAFAGPRAAAQRSVALPLCAPWMLLLASTFASAQDATPAAGAAARLPVTVVPGFSASQTFTRNDAATSGVQRSEFVTQLSPSLHLSAGAGRIKGFLDYSLDALAYARDSNQNDVRQSLNAKLSAEAIPNMAFIDASANISQQSISAFGQQFGDDTLATSNRAEVFSFAVSPYLRGVLGGVVDYDARVSQSGSHSSAAGVADSSATSAQLQFGGATALSGLRWSALASHQRFAFSDGRPTVSDRGDASLSYVFDAQLNVSLHAGRESSNYTGNDKQTTNTTGLSMAWRPSELTTLSGSVEHRPFGNTHSLSLLHRTGRTVLTYSDSRSISNGVGQTVFASLGTAFQLYDQMFASQQPDPVLRQQLVLDFLKQYGISPNAVIINSFLASSLTLQRQQALSAAWQGVRDTVTATVSRSTSENVDTLAGATGIFATAGTIRQQGFTLSLGHRLTPTASLTLSAAQQRTSGSAGGLSARYNSVDLAWSDQIGARTRATLTARRTTSQGPTAPYTETAVTAGVNFTF